MTCASLLTPTYYNKAAVVAIVALTLEWTGCGKANILLV